jgi:4-hydroxy-3-methylbut-2-enyl diphosphate reductase IspH
MIVGKRRIGVTAGASAPELLDPGDRSIARTRR